MHSNGFILGITNRYHGYRFTVEWQRHSCTGDSVALAAARHIIIIIYIHPSAMVRVAFLRCSQIVKFVNKVVDSNTNMYCA
jgi:hypothetical protein